MTNPQILGKLHTLSFWGTANREKVMYLITFVLETVVGKETDCEGRRRFGYIFYCIKQTGGDASLQLEGEKMRSERRRGRGRAGITAPKSRVQQQVKFWVLVDLSPEASVLSAIVCFTFHLLILISRIFQFYFDIFVWHNYPQSDCSGIFSILVGILSRWVFNIP